MNLGELLTQARLELDDTEVDYLWSDEELISYINEAQDQACRRSRLIMDSTTESICNIPVISGQALYSLDSRILAIKSIVNQTDDPLCAETVNSLTEKTPKWRAINGEPRVVITDYETDKIMLYPKPTASGTIKMRVVRMPLIAMVGLQDVPEIKSRYHMALIHWVKHRAYLKKDADTLDKNASVESLALFELEFGKARPAYSIEFDLNNLPYDNLDGSW